MAYNSCFRVVVPYNFDIESKIKKSPPDFRYNIDFFYYLIHFILEKNALKQDSREYLFGRFFISICSNMIQPFNRFYNKHLLYLKNEGVIDRWRYTKNRCFSFQLTKEYSRNKLKYYDIYDKDLVDKYYEENHEIIPNKLRKKYNFLLRHLDFNRIKVDFEAAFNENNEDSQMMQYDYKKFIRNAVKLCEINSGVRKVYYKEDTDGRVHTPITQLSKSLRKYIVYDGTKKLSEVDLSNSVPFFLYLSLSNTSLLTSNTIKKPLPYMSVKKAYNVDQEELRRFGKIVVDGEFYECFKDDYLKLDREYFKNEYIEKILKGEYKGEDKQVRKVIKRTILSMMFARNRHFEKEQEIFKKHFPTIYKFIFQIKKWRYKRLSHFMLQLEAHFMLDIVAREYNNDKDGKNELLLTLHDCLITTSDNVINLQEFLLTQFKNKLNIAPQTKVKHWGESSSLEDDGKTLQQALKDIKPIIEEILIKHASLKVEYEYSDVEYE